MAQESYTKDPVPEFGHALVKYWNFDEGYINLNHGSYGSLPAPVIQACSKIDAELEGNPDKFIRVAFSEKIKAIRARVAKVINAETDEVVVVPNTTHGVNTVLRNIDWKAGDVIIKNNITYGAIAKTMQYIADVTPGVQITSFDITTPTTHAKIFESCRKHVSEVKSTKAEGAKIVLVLDAIASNPGMLLPWERVVDLCTQEGVISVVDAAHAIGQQLDIDVSKTKPDFWISNCHKWLYAKRGCAVLYVPKRNQHILKTSLPTSFGYVSPSDYNATSAPNFIGQFEWNGTIDPTPYLSIGPALDFREWLGGETKINNYTRALAIAGGKRVAEILGTYVMDDTENSELTLNMTNVKLPIPDTPDSVYQKVITFFIGKTLYQYNCSVTPFHYNEVWWVRFSAQVYNEISDFEYAGKALSDLCKEIMLTEIDESGAARESQPTGAKL